jgi:hypothetical protein
MQCYHLLDRNAEALAVYQRCHKMLATLNTEPGQETKTLYRQIQEGGAAGAHARAHGSS